MSVLESTARRSTVATPPGARYAMGRLRSAILPKPVTTVSEWADRYRVLTSKGSGEPGQWRTSRTPYLREIMDQLSATSPVQRIVLRFAAQLGKALDLDTPIPTPDGWARMGDIEAGDLVFDERGIPVRVLIASETFHNRACYRVVFSDGSEIIADGAHRWTVTDELDYRNRIDVTLTTDALASTCKHGRRNRYAIPVTRPLNLPPADLPIDPYTLGVWLGDGNSYSAQFTQHADDAPEVSAMIERGGHRVIERDRNGKTLTLQIDAIGVRDGQCLRGHVLADVGTYQVTKHGRRCHVCAECQRQHAMKHRYGKEMDPIVRPSFYARLGDLNLISNKHIPPAYLRGSANQRMELLRGLMDTDGHADAQGGNCEISSSYPSLASGIIELIRSLGFKPRVKRRRPKGVQESTRISFQAYRDWPVFHLSRKRKRLRSLDNGRPSETFRRRIVAVEPVASRPVRCIAVDSPNHLFLAGKGMIPTHNTEVGLNWIGYVMDHAPGPMLVVLPTLEVRKRWVRQRLDPLLNATPALREIFDARSKRDAGNAEDMKDFPGGLLVIGGANSPASLASMPIRYVLCDEVDRFPWEAGREGDPLGLIDERTKTFPRRKVMLVSTPTTAGLSRIDDEYMASDRREYQVPCPHCGTHQVLRWRRADGEYSLTRHEATGAVWYRCADCDGRIEEHHKPALLAAGRWVAEHPGRPVRGYALNGLYSPIGLGYTWAELLTQWADAHGDTAKLKRFVNTTLGEVWEEEGDSLDPLHLMGRIEDYPDARLGGLRVVGVDVQKDRLELTVADIGAGEEIWVQDHLILPGDTALAPVWADLGDELAALRPDACAIDTGYNTSLVNAFAATRAWVWPVKGMPGPNRPIVEDELRRRQRLRHKRRKGAPIYLVGVDQAKALIYARVKIQAPGPGYIHFPSRPAFDDEYFAQLAAEKLITKVRGTRAHAEWVQTRARNEALDCMVYVLAAARLCGKDPAPQPPPQRKATRKEDRKSWLNVPSGWLKK